MDQEDRIDIYTIPPNFAEEGTMLSGRIKTRNAVETVILLAVLLPVLYSLQLPVKAKLYIGIIVLVPLTIFAVIGVQGESLSAFVGSFLRFLRRRRVLTVPDERYRLEQNRRREKREREERKNREKKVKKSESRKSERREPGRRDSETGNLEGGGSGIREPGTEENQRGEWSRTGKIRGAKAETKQEAHPAADEKRTSGRVKRGKANK